MFQQTQARVGAAMLAAVLVTGCNTSTEEESGSPSGSRNETPVASIQHTTTTEGSRGQRIISVPVQLSVATTKGARIQYETVSGTATAGEDFVATSGELIFAKGNRRKDISITLISDTKDEPEEAFEVRLTGAQNAELDRAAKAATITLTDDDAPPEIAFTSERQVVSERVGQTTVQASLSVESGFTVEVPLTVAGTAQENGDYVISGGRTLSWAPGERTQTVTVEITADTIPEGGETVLLGFGQPANATIDPEPSMAQHALIIAGDVALNDTGMQTFASDFETGLASEPSTHPGQDARYGRDVTDNSPSDGIAGFSFTKIDSAGNPLPASATQWTCVRDNATGLVWENKQPAMDTPAAGYQWRAASYVYTWFNPDGSVNGGNSGAVNAVEGRPLSKNEPKSSQCAYRIDAGRKHNLYCNSEAYTLDANFYGLCGFDDWRLPTAQELRSIYHYHSDQEASLPDPNFFGHTASTQYLSSTPSADNDASAWCVSESGDVQLCHKGIAAAVRLVRKGE